jgi:hypothetical protein
MKKAVKIIVVIVVASFTVSMFFLFQKKENSPAPQPQTSSLEQQQIEEKNIPQAIATETAATETANAPTPLDPSLDPLPAKFLLQISFYSQAPFGNWDKIHEEMCEESSVLNAGLFLLGEKPSKDIFEKELMDFKKLEEKKLGDYKSNTIAEIKKVADIYFAGKISSKIIVSPTIEDIEKEIAAGNPVIAPLAGRDIGNPNFTPPGPVYHMLVIKGYDTQNFITNDVGTRKGESYTYKKDIIMKNMHDWNPQDIHLGAKRVLVLYK